MPAGRSADGGGKFAIVRYESDGALDSTFGGDGKVTTNFTVGEDDRASGVAIQANGKIVAAGTAFLNCDCSSFGLVRYDPDGTRERTFGGDGKVSTHFTSGSEAHAVAIQADGKIVVAGGHPDVNRFQVARYDPDGTLDTTFSDNGKATTDMGEGEEAATSVAIQANGKVVVAGYTDVPHEYGDPGPGKFALARYRVGGTLDPLFNGDGRLTTSFGSETVLAFGVAIQADGKIVAAGRGVNKGGRFVLSRYEPDGTLDTTFSGNGRVTLNFTADDDVANGVVIQADGSIMAAGLAGGNGGRFALARFLGS